jgi:S-DNA-T family DNA segregation ATPase FtsK/SpoIIIE
MHVAFIVEGVERELDLDVASGHGTVGDLAAALSWDAPGSGLVIDGRYWAPDTPLGDLSLRQGAVLEPASGPPPGSDAPAPAAVLSVAGGLGAGATLDLSPGRHTLGRDPERADVVIDDPTVSGGHARLDVNPEGVVVVADLESRNGTVVEGYKPGGPLRLGPGEVVQTGAVLWRTGKPPAVDASLLGRPRRGGTAAFNRPPRAMERFTPVSLRVPPPPKKLGEATRFGIGAMLAPVIFGAGTAVVSKNLMMASFALLSPVMMMTNRMEEKRRTGKDRARGDKEFNAALVKFRRALLTARQAEVARRRTAFPDPAEVLRRATGPSVRVWERRPAHDDFLKASVGAARVPWTPPLESPSGERPVEIDEAIAQLGWLPSAPLVTDLTAAHTLGVVGDRAAALALARGVICQLAVNHGPADLRVAVLTEPDRAAEWDWVKWLPHVRSTDEASGRHLLGAAPEDQSAVLDELSVVPPRPSPGQEAPSGPVTLVVVDAPALLEGRNSPARDVLAGQGVPACGLVLAATADQLPALSSSVIELNGANGAARYREPAFNLTVEPVLVSGMTEELARQCGRALSALEDPEVADVGADLPSGVALVELIGSDVTAGALAKRWKAAGRVPSLGAPMGVCGDGPLELDLVSDGPHALIAGTTGAGKSELLRSIVAGMAATVDSEHLNFVLIDYKGGSAFANCADLPHTVGMVTDLDEHLGARALRCLEAELHYRETRLRDAGASDLKEYLRAGHPDPLPRLVVIIDEFATMAAELPDFIDSLVGIAQRGRSLGVHMILATQRPGGAVNDNIRANTNLRISLRVQEAAESADIVGSPLAASIGRKQAGRGYVRLGAAEVFPFQAALVTGVTKHEEQSAVRVARFVFGPDPIAPDQPPGAVATAAAAPAAAAGAPTEVSDLEVLVAAAAEAARLGGLAEPRRPWPETLPQQVTLDELADPPTVDARGPIVGAGAPFGLADDPSNQRRALFSWAPPAGNFYVCGMSGSGTTETLASVAVSLARAYGPERLWIYGFDFGTQALAGLAGLPHCGGIIGSSDRERQFRLVRFLADELERRRRYVASSGAVRIDPADPASPFPSIVVLIDNYGALSAAWDDVTGSALRDVLVRTIADGPGLGLVAAISTDRPLGLPGALGSVVPNKLALRLAEPTDLAFFGLNPREVGKLGFLRGVDASTKLELQVAVAHPDGLNAGVAATAAAYGQLDAAVRPPAIGTLTDEVPLQLVKDGLRIDGEGWFLPLGIADATLAPAGLLLREGEHAFFAGPARCGKSTTLDAIAAMVGAAHPEVVISAIALRRSPLTETKEITRLITSAEQIATAVEEILADMSGPQLVLVDDADGVDDPMGNTMTNLVGTNRGDVHVIVAARADAIRSNYVHWSGKVRSSRQGLALKPDDIDANLWTTTFPRASTAGFPPGRGYLIADGIAALFQAAKRD